jgi:hypothetical protein
MNDLAPDTLEEILTALDVEIEARGGDHTDLVVCGGAALIALGFVSRTTKDVDVLGAAEESPDSLLIRRIHSFPPWLDDSADAVRANYRLKGHWLNLGPASQLDTGMPEGYERRLTTKSYGAHLTVRFIGRLDQIHLKLYASVDRGGYHVDDLRALNPTDDEIEQAARWVQTQDVSEPFRLILIDFLEKFGRGHVAERV